MPAMKRTMLAVLALVGCGSSPKPTPPPKVAVTAAPAEKTLFERLGGQPAITAVVHEFLVRTTADPRVQERFFNTDAALLEKLLVEMVCAASGGPCTYSGRDMETTHAGMEVTDEEFTALVESLVGALDKFQVPEREKGELLGAIGPLKPQIVTPADKLRPIDDAQLAKVTAAASKLKNERAVELLGLAVSAGKRGQRSYAEQLFMRAEMIVGVKPLAAVAGVFREGAPPRVTTALQTLPADTAPQPKAVGSSEADEPEKQPAKGSLTGTLLVGGAPAKTMGVVMLWPERGGKKRTPKKRIVEQRDRQFAPAVMAVPVGSTVSFPNFDAIYHNVFSLSKTKPFDLGMYKSGESRDVKVDKPGIVRLGCNIHANMSAHLVVVDAPHYVVVEDGTFTFRSLAPGKYKVQAWVETSAEPVTSTLEIKEGANQTELALEGGAPSRSPDKFGVARQ